MESIGHQGPLGVLHRHNAYKELWAGVSESKSCLFVCIHFYSCHVCRAIPHRVALMKVNVCLFPVGKKISGSVHFLFGAFQCFLYCRCSVPLGFMSCLWTIEVRRWMYTHFITLNLRMSLFWLQGHLPFLSQYYEDANKLMFPWPRTAMRRKFFLFFDMSLKFFHFTEGSHFIIDIFAVVPVKHWPGSDSPF